MNNEHFKHRRYIEYYFAKVLDRGSRIYNTSFMENLSPARSDEGTTFHIYHVTAGKSLLITCSGTLVIRFRQPLYCTISRSRIGRPDAARNFSQNANARETVGQWYSYMYAPLPVGRHSSRSPPRSRKPLLTRRKPRKSAGQTNSAISRAEEGPG